MPGRGERLAALLEEHADAAEEIGFLVLFGRAATAARPNKARATQGDIREAVGETRLCPAGSRSWQMSVLAACAAARDHIDDLKAGALSRFRREASMPVRELLGRQWMTYIADAMSDNTAHDPFWKENLSVRTVGGVTCWLQVRSSDLRSAP